MSELEVLNLGIVELRRMLSDYWRDLGSLRLTPYERAEIRSKMVSLTEDLRQCVHAREIECNRRLSHAQNAWQSHAVQLRVLNKDYVAALGPVLATLPAETAAVPV